MELKPELKMEVAGQVIDHVPVDPKVLWMPGYIDAIREEMLAKHRQFLVFHSPQFYVEPVALGSKKQTTKKRPFDNEGSPG
jgi:hypothetical protein